MSSDKSEAGRRFAGDLQRIREAKGISLDEMVLRIKAPTDVLEAFEATGLVDHPMYNRVYLRSFAKSYAEVLRLPAGLVLAGIEGMLAGRYDDTLAARYLHTAPGDDDGQDSESADEVGASATEATENSPDSDEVQQPTDGSDAADSERSADSGATRTAEAQPTVDVGSTVDGGDEGETSGPAADAGEVAETSAPDKPDLATPAGIQSVGPQSPGSVTSAASGAAAGSRVMTPRIVVPVAGASVTAESTFAFDGVSKPTRRPWVWLLGAIAVVVVLFAAFWFWPDRTEPPIETPPVPAQDTVFVQEAPPRMVLADTMRFVLIATDTLDPIRITADAGVRQPFWVEAGDSLTVEALDRIRIEREVNGISLWIQGWQLPTTGADTLGRLDLTRGRVQEVLDSLRLSL